MQFERLNIFNRHVLILESHVLNFEKELLKEKIQESIKKRIISDLQCFKGFLSILIFSSKIKSKKNYKSNRNIFKRRK